MRIRGGFGLWLVLLLAFPAIGCWSPNRGRWAGTFDGSVDGTVEFEINARGTRLSGRMQGATRSGEPFQATLEGILREDFIDAGFAGTAGSTAGLPVTFEGRMSGSLADGEGTGDWQATLRFAGTRMAGTWSVARADQL